MFPLYLPYLLIDFRQTFVTGASWDTDGLITFLGQKVKVQGHTIAAEAHTTQRYRRVQLFLVEECMTVCPAFINAVIFVAVQNDNAGEAELVMVHLSCVPCFCIT